MVGQNIGKYRVLDRIGRGGMGTVYRALDETLHREVALKILNAELNDPSVARRFRAEAVTVARLSHPGIATIYELLQHDGQWLMVMEFVRGETLEAIVARRGPLSVTEAAGLCMQALGALAHAHSLGVVHRDLKPANLMVTDAGAVKIMDFGIARVAGTEHLTSAGFMMGTPAYMAPEQVRGEDIDARADLYAMGVVLYHLVTAKLPFAGDTPFDMAQSRLRERPTPVRALRAELPEWFSRVLDLALDREPLRRFQSAPMFREALRRGLANLPLETSAAASVPTEIMLTPVPSGATSPLDRDRAAASGEQAPHAVPRPQPIEARPDPSTVKARTDLHLGSEPERTRARRLAIASVLVLGVVLGWFALRWIVQPAAPPPAAPAGEIQTAGGAAAGPPATDGPLAPSAVTASGASTSPAPHIDTPRSSPSASPPTAPGSGSSGPSASGTSAPNRGAGAGTTVVPAATGRAADLPVSFSDTRLLAVRGRTSEELTGIVNFGGGHISVASPDGVPLATMPYRDLSYALYTRGRDPRWSVVLAAPPPDVDLPGGMFRPSRHWLTLQSRAAFMILRLSDGRWAEIVETVTARTGVPVARPTSRQD